MKLFLRIITSACIGYIIYCVLNLVFGQSGVLAMQDLEGMKRELQSNISVIEKNYELLSSELTGLRNSPEKISLEARSIGYYRENEGVIVVEGYEGRKNFFALGKLVKIEQQEKNRKPLFRAAAFGTVLLILIFITITAKKKSSYKKVKSRSPAPGKISDHF